MTMSGGLVEIVWARPSVVDTERLLHAVLAGRLGRSPAEVTLTARCRICGGPHGKPQPIDGVHFNLSHAGDRVVVAMTTLGPVGVDVELREAASFRGFDGVALAESERGIAIGERATVWTRKEAVLKATGHGLAISPSDVEVSAPDEPARFVAWHAADPPDELVQMLDLDLGADYAACVAVLSARSLTARVVEFTGEAAPLRTATR